MQAIKPKSSADAVLEAVHDIHAQEQIVTRETLSAHTGLKLSVIDDRLSYLVNEGVIHRVQRGVFVPAQTHRTARYVTRSLLPDGTTVLEVGDTVLVLTPREARMVGELMAGAAQQYSAIEVGHQSAQLNGRLAGELRDLRREVRKLIEAN